MILVNAVANPVWYELHLYGAWVIVMNKVKTQSIAIDGRGD